MKEITVREAQGHETDWVNKKYKEVDFVISNPDKELIVIAECENIKCGLGRLVVIDEDNIELGGIYVFESYRKLGVADKIVTFLCEENSFNQKTVWCLPFSNLKNFYNKFGFTENWKRENRPSKIGKKHNWCNSNYNKPVLLLSKNN